MSARNLIKSVAAVPNAVVVVGGTGSGRDVRSVADGFRDGSVWTLLPQTAEQPLRGQQGAALNADSTLTHADHPWKEEAIVFAGYPPDTEAERLRWEKWEESAAKNRG